MHIFVRVKLLGEIGLSSVFFGLFQLIRASDPGSVMGSWGCHRWFSFVFGQGLFVVGRWGSVGSILEWCEVFKVINSAQVCIAFGLWGILIACHGLVWFVLWRFCLIVL